MAEPGDFLCSLLEFLGLSTEGTGERVQAIALLVFLVLFGIATGCFTEGLASQLWFGVAGVSTILLALAIWWRR